MGVGVLGPVQVAGSRHDTVRLGSRDRVVLAVLAMRADMFHTPEQLADAVWGERLPPTWAKALQGCVSRLRKQLGPEAIDTSPEGYRLALPVDEVDAWRFERLVGRAGELLTLGEPERSAYTVSQAMGLWRGRPLTELEDWGPGAQEAGRLEELRLDAEELQLDAGLQAGHHREVLAQAQAMVQAAPMRERRWSLLASAQYQSGRQAEALRTLHRLRRMLAEELGLDPSPEAVALEQAILRQDPSLMVEEVAELVSDSCPYQGLTPYDEADAESFFGRGEELARCRERLAAEGVLAVVGPSGSGKSSLVRAGIAASLAVDRTPVTVVTPGRRPMDALTGALSAVRRPVLVIDQAEEVFSLCDDDEEQRSFLAALEGYADTAPVVVALRADRTGEVSAHPAFARLVERGLFLLGAMSEQSLRDAIERPAHQSGLVVEPGLVDLLIREVEGEPGALPLLSHALRETWLRREGRTLTVAGYQAAGGIRGAVAQSAEEVYGRVPEGDRSLLRDLLMRLVAPGFEGEPVRARVPRRMVGGEPVQERLVDLLVSARLVTSDDGVVELAHESLVRAWPRLRGWLDDDVEGRRILHHLVASADAWDTLGRPDSELYRGIRLDQVVAWREANQPDLNLVERDFLDAARASSAAHARSAEEHARQQARLIRRLRLTLGGAAVLLVLALLAGWIAAVQSNQSRDAAEEARRTAVSADARRIGTRAQLIEDINLSLLLAAAGARLEDSPETRMNLLTALAKRPLLVRSVQPGGGYLEPFDVSRDGRWIASSDDQNRMHLYDASTSRLLRSYDAGRLPGDEQAFMVARFSPDSRQLAVILSSGTTEPVRLLDPSTMQPTTKLDIPGGKPVWGVDVQFSADGRYLAATVQTVDWPKLDASDARGYAVVWDLRAPSVAPVRVPTGTQFQGMALSPDGRTLYTASPLTAYDVATGNRIWRREDVSASYGGLDVNAQGTLLAVADDDLIGPVPGRPRRTYAAPLLVSTSTGATVHTLGAQRDPISEIRFSPDGMLAGSVSWEGELIVWDTATGLPLERWDTFAGWGVGFSPDGDLVYSGGGDSMLRTWDLSMENTYLQQTTQVDDVNLFTHASFSPDGQRVAYSWRDTVLSADGQPRWGPGWVRFVDLVTGEPTPPARVPVSGGAYPSGAWHPRGLSYGATCVTGDCAGGHAVVRTVDPSTGRVLRTRKIFDGSMYSIGYVDGGRSLLAGGSDVFSAEFGPDNQTLLVDAETLEPRAGRLDLTAHNVVPIGDGSTAMIHEYSSDLTSIHWRVIDVGTGDVLSEGDVNLGVISFAASPDGSTVAVAGTPGEVVTIDVATGDQQRSDSLGADVISLDYSDDGELLVAGADDGGVSLWDASTLELLGTISPPRRGDAIPAGAQFIGDTHDVAIASYDGVVYRWRTDLEHAIDFACQVAGRDLTEGEWAEFLPAQPYQSVCADR